MTITLQTHLGINIRLQYIRYIYEYILKLQIHQHSLLTRKVFFRHHFQHWSSSLYRLDHLIIVIFKLSSSSSLLHQVWIITWSGASLDHHQVWIITGSSSKLDHHHHHCFCYLNQMVLSIHSSRHRKFYRASPFSCWL